MTRTRRADGAVARCRRFSGRLLALLGSGLALGVVAHKAVAQILQQQQQAPGVTVQRQSGTPNVKTQGGQGGVELRQKPTQGTQILPPAAKAQPVDTTGIWYWLRLHNLKAAEAEFMRLKQANPQWRPPSDLLVALREAEHPPAAQLPGAAAHLPLTEAMIKATRNAGSAIGRGWHYLNSGNPAKAAQWFSAAISWGGDSSAREGLGRSLLAEGNINAVKTMHPLPPALREPLADALLNRALEWADQGAPMTEIAADANSATDFGKSDAWETVGWRLFDHHRPDDALAAFTRAAPTENAVFGRVLAMRAAGHEAAASTLACERRSTSKRLAQACADSLASRELDAYKAGDFGEAEKLGDRLGDIAPNRRDARALTAWSAYHAGDPKKAASIFAELYDRKPDHDLAVGLALSLRAAGETPLLEERVAAGDKTLGDIVAADNANTAWYRKQFDLAATGPSPNPSLAGREGWLVGTGMETAVIPGAPGQLRFNTLAGRIFAEGMVGDARLGLSLTGAGVDIGTPTPDALIGLRPPTGPFAPTSGAGLIQPELTALWEAPNWTTGTLLGLTPLNAAVAPLPTGSVSVTHYMDPVILSGRAFAQSVTQSLLSLGGMRDPVTGTSWGRVMDLGGSLQAIYLPAERVSLSFTGEGAYLTGDNVASNNRLSLRLDAAYDFRPHNFDHLRVGPFVSFAHFQRNLDFFTFGQGGYYSPDADARTGILIDLLTAEGQRWQIEAKQSLAAGNVTEAASPAFPLSGSSRASSSLVFAGTSFWGFDSDSQLRGSVLLSDHLILSGFAGYSSAPGYNGYVAGVFMSVPFEARRGVFSVDLPDSTYRPFDVWK
jgi:cellulose synthase operon protein C